MIQDLTISYARNGIETTLTIKDDHDDNLPYNLADIFEKVIRESGANPQSAYGFADMFRKAMEE